ncbi:MAG TPA: hypothetical protein VLC48_03210 [Gemmatimonadota bacterium]|nr:hypothetical protein [Gemmatimonadota bacterium]
MNGFKKLIREVHRRSLWQVLGIYLVSAWIAYEVVQSLTEGLNLPAWFPGFAVVLFIIGLPIVLATAIVQEGIGPGATAQETTGTAKEEALPSEPAAPLPSGARRLLTWKSAIGGGVLAMALWGVAATGWLMLGGRSDGGGDATAAVDPNVVAVFPFRVAGADAALDYLREGMVDLLAAKLTGEGGPRAVDPRAVMSAWNRASEASGGELSDREARELARSLGAGRVLLGGVVGTPTRLVLNASLVTVDDAGDATQAGVEGASDSLTVMVDKLTAQLLAQEAGESQQRLAALTSTSLPALRAYLDGQASYRRGAYEDAVQHFRRAFEFDSTFALAALGYVSARYWTINGFDSQGLDLAWRHRDRLSERDRTLLLALAGPDYPVATPGAATMAARQRAVESAPDRPEGWYWLGEYYYHQGAALGLSAWRELAGDAFRRTMQLDSAFSGSIGHLIDVAVMAGDREMTERMLARYLAVNTGEFRDYERWQVALAFGDSVKVDSVRALFPELNTLVLRAVIRTSMLKGFDADDDERAAVFLRARTAPPGELVATQSLLHDYELARGRPTAALAATERIAQAQPESRQHLHLRVLDALYGGGDVEAGTSAAQQLMPYAAAPFGSASERIEQYQDVCTLEQWRLWHGERSSASATIARLRSSTTSIDTTTATATSLASYVNTCATLLGAIDATLSSTPDAGRRVTQLDSLLRQLPPAIYFPDRLDRSGHLALAQLFESLGDLGAAYKALQRREFFVSRYLADYMREEGRLAALLGDREAAIRAYRHYLALRSDPEPALADEVELVRAELASLIGGDAAQ